MENFEADKSKDVLYPAVAKEITEMAEADQKMRMAPEKDFHHEEWLATDMARAERMKQIIKEIGWPTVSKVGKEASESASLMVRHADHDVSFQKECLELMKKESHEEVSEIDIAYLHDRICVNEGRPQYFGTQFTDDKYNAYGPQPIEDILDWVNAGQPSD